MNDAVQNLRVRTSIDGVDQAQAKLKGLNTAISGIVASIGLAALAYKGLTAAIETGKKAVENYNQAVTAIRQVSSVLQSTGRAAEFSTKELSEMASEMQKLSNFGDEDIMQNATLSLLRFGSVTKDIFPRAQQLVLDMSAQTGNLSDAARTLGISLEDPILGLSRLRRQGIAFTEGQQDLIKALVESGEKAKAQGILLDALEAKYKGQAAASIDATKQLNNAWGDYLETLGKSLTFIDGIKRGFTAALIDMSGQVDFTSKQAQIAALESQRKWGEATIIITRGVEDGFTLIVSLIHGAVNVVTTIADVASAAFTTAISEMATQIIKFSKWLTVNNPLSIMAIGFDGLIEKITGKKFNLDFIVKAQTTALNQMQASINPLLDDLDNAFGRSGKKWSEWGNAIGSMFKDTLKNTDAQMNLLNRGIDDQIDALNKSLAGITMPDIDNSETEQALKQLKTTLDLSLTALATYYDETGKYSDQWVEAQAEMYAQNIKNQYAAYLTAAQIDEMVKSKRIALIEEQHQYQLAVWADENKALQDNAAEALKFWQDATAKRKEIVATQYELELSFTKDRERWLDIRSAQIQAEYDQHVKNGVNIVIAERWKTNEIQKLYTELDESMQTMAERSYNIMANAQMQFIQSVEHAVGGAINDMIMGTETLQSSMTKLWANIRASVIREISAMIAKMLVMLAVQKLLGGVTGNAGWLANLFGLAAPGAQTAAAPVSMPEATTRNLATGAGAIGSALPDTGNRQLTDAINQLRRDMQADRETNLNLYIDGQQLRHSLKKAEIRLNSMSS